ncbi:endolytic transglycosylase MltG [Helicobacter cholecystus]|uniref:Endolytic murein transglycosylase n=2 Tax=Helicobacter cholecystus TaxID=45498 RepID=A0A3D8IVZ1_9HELI|nr:endolytic transglycosylase MltG [Helicobacter cholecystus]VEJ24627.1 aminodeoxychorismate lyase [Helicobacter cholecystus]
MLNLPKGSIRAIVTYLQTQKIDLNAFDGLILRILGNPQSGWIDLGEKQMSRGDFLYKLTVAKAPLKEVKLIPGESMHFFIIQLSEVLNISIQELWKAYRAQVQCEEGNILPQTYKIPYGIDASRLFIYLLEYSNKEYSRIANALGYNLNTHQWKRIISKASIIQKEAANASEMPIISAVIDNRIAKGMPLQMDGSLNYGEFSHTKVTPERIRNDKSTFNTYLHKGIPPCPCGSVGLEAIKSAVHPQKVDYLYFVRNKNGVHTFSKTYQEHRENFKY